MNYCLVAPLKRMPEKTISSSKDLFAINTDMFKSNNNSFESNDDDYFEIDNDPLVLYWLYAGIVYALGTAAYTAYSLMQDKKKNPQCRIIGIIPAEGNPLLLILGKPMIQRTWERAKKATALDHVVVATDDMEIAECCRGFGADVIMTSKSCKNGTERCSETLEKLSKKYDIVVSIPQNEPLIEPKIVDDIVKSLQGDPNAVSCTAATSLKPEDGPDPNMVKCVVDNKGYAIYFSRSRTVYPGFQYLLHLGIQSYSAQFLKKYPELPPTPLQIEEDLDQLKVLANRYKMKVIKVDHEHHGVYTTGDVKKVESFMQERNIH